MTKKLGLVASMCAVVALLLVLAPGSAEARRYRGSFGAAPGASTFGIGLILGTPTGLSLELRLSPRTALDLAIGFDSFDDDDDGDDDGYVHFDYLVYFAQVGGASVAVPFYVGFGAVVWDDHHDFDNDDLNLGVRVPFGVAIALRAVPLQFFFELAVRVLVVDDGPDENDNIDLTGGLGFRIYF